MLFLNKVLNFLVEHENASDGGLHSLFSIIKYYRGNLSSIDLNKYIEKYYPLTTLELLKVASFNCGLFCVVYDINISYLIKNSQPVIIRLSKNQIDSFFVVCYGYDKKKGLFISDSVNGDYYISTEAFQNLSFDKKGLVFLDKISKKNAIVFNSNF